MANYRTPIRLYIALLCDVWVIFSLFYSILCYNCLYFRHIRILRKFAYKMTISADDINIGDIKLAGRVFLAPMSGVTDLPFRRAVTDIGGVTVVSEMVACEQLAQACPDALRRAEGAGLSPFVMQLAGRNPQWMYEGAKLACAAGVDIIDINMGCPSRRVTGGLSGAALMRDLALAEDIIAATLAGSTRPVTLKMRLGWDENNLNAVQLAILAEKLGVQLITVHGRTRCQFYKGQADWAAIRPVVEAVNVPIIANGDIVDGASAQAALAACGAAGVMIGRAAIGRPWLASQINHYLASGVWPDEPSCDEKWRLVADWYQATLAHYAHDKSAHDEGVLGVRVARKHLAGFIDDQCATYANADAKALRAYICRLDNPQAVLAALYDMYNLWHKSPSEPLKAVA